MRAKKSIDGKGTSATMAVEVLACRAPPSKRRNEREPRRGMALQIAPSPRKLPQRGRVQYRRSASGTRRQRQGTRGTRRAEATLDRCLHLRGWAQHDERIVSRRRQPSTITQRCCDQYRCTHQVRRHTLGNEQGDAVDLDDGEMEEKKAKGGKGNEIE